MMPASGYMDSNPQMRNQVPYPQHYFPGFEAVPPHYKADASKSPMMYESWPCGSRYPVPYHGCCNHGNFPGYYSYRPSCPQFAPSPAFHHYPNYPSYPEPYPVYYAPPPHYLNEQPRYEYDKDLHANYHCCGCPNHLHNQKNDRCLKIEEQENDDEKMESDSVVPIQPKSYPYPIVWIPPEYMKSREHGKHNDRIEVSDMDEAPCLVRPSKSSRPTDVTEQQQRARNGWFPLNMNGLKSLVQGQGETQSENQQNQDKMADFPFPIFWVPSSDRKREEGENSDKGRMITASGHSEQAPVEVEPFVTDAKTDKPQLEKEISQNKNATETKGTSARQKCVPIEVKEAKSEGTENKGRDASMKRAAEATKNAAGTVDKRKSPSPAKTSKLPPICLRVDPLPKKRNGNGRSRSPSPPKGQPEDTSTKVSTALKIDSAVNTQNISGSLDNVEPGEKKRKDIPVIEERSKENKAGEVNTQKISVGLDNEEPGERKRKDIPVIDEGSKENKAGETTGASQAQVSINSKDEQKTSSEKVIEADKEAASVEAANPVEPTQCKEAKRMSGDEAAKLIQSAFRGFEVRKWEPLKKLKQIANVRRQVDEVINLIRSLESSSDRDKDDKLRLLIGEKIMSLLLQLDTIQGFDSSVRDARKSLVKELVILQERLDSLTSKWAEVKAEDLGKAKSADSPTGRSSGDVSMEKESDNASAALEDTKESANIEEPEQECKESESAPAALDDTNENTNLKEPEQECLAHIVDGKDNETTDANIDNNTTEATSYIECHTAAPRIEDKDVSLNLEHMTCMPSVPEQKPNDFAEVDDIKEEVLVDGDSEDDKADNVNVNCEPEKEMGNSNGEKESDLQIVPSLLDEEEDLRCIDEVQGIDLLKELPVGVINEETAMSQVDEHLPEAESNKNVEDEKVNEFTNKPELEIEMNQNKVNEVNNPELEVEMNQNEVNGNNKSESFSIPEEVHSTAGEEHNEELQQQEDNLATLPADQTVTSESEAGSEATEEKQVLFEEKKGAEHPVGTGTKIKDDVPSESKAEQELGCELIAKIKEDNKLIEENNKLKEMMEKFMEAGKDQLTIISNLTERVKDLEQKLSMARSKKKSSKAGYRKLRYAPSYYKPVKAKHRDAQVSI